VVAYLCVVNFETCVHITDELVFPLTPTKIYSIFQIKKEHLEMR